VSGEDDQRGTRGFVVEHDHFTPDIERIAERHPAYLLVEKLPTYQGADPSAG
jgi:hypothetical protein